MSLVGKIFTVLIFLASVVLATFALTVYATQTNWRLVAENDKPPEIDRKGLLQRVEKAQKDFKDLGEQKKKIEEECKTEKERQDRALAAVETENQALRKDRGEDEQKLAALEEGLRKAVKAMQDAHRDLARLQAETDQLRKNIALAKADREAQFKQVVRLTDELHQAVAERMRLEKLNRDLAEQLAQARAANPGMVPAAKPPAANPGMAPAGHN
ncbi:MAG: hypothetical protein ABSG86_31305 [Thermoguttaceae bacterium]|jgi:chromosome segregation ATPase